MSSSDRIRREGEAPASRSRAEGQDASTAPPGDAGPARYSAGEIPAALTASPEQMEQLDGALVQFRRAVGQGGAPVQREEGPAGGDAATSDAGNEAASASEGEAASSGASRARPIPPIIAGLASPMAMARSSVAAHAVANTWDVMTPDQRRDELVEAVNTELRSYGVPVPETEVVPLDTGGLLDPVRWVIQVSENRFATSSARDVPALASTLYHEARHAEQFFRMGRLLAGRGRQAAQIAEALALRADIAEQAAAAPLPPDSPQAAEAERWYQSVYGSGADERGEVVAGMREAANTTRREDPLTATPPGASPEERAAQQERYEAARREYRDATDTYRQLPEEADANSVERRWMETHRRIDELGQR